MAGRCSCGLPDCRWVMVVVSVFNDTATTEIYTLSLHDALPISTLFPTIFPTSTWLPIRDLPFLWTTSLPALLNLSTLSFFFLHRSFYNLPPFLHFVSTLLRPWQQ